MRSRRRSLLMTLRAEGVVVVGQSPQTRHSAYVAAGGCLILGVWLLGGKLESPQDGSSMAATIAGTLATLAIGAAFLIADRLTYVRVDMNRIESRTSFFGKRKIIYWSDIARFEIRTVLGTSEVYAIRADGDCVVLNPLDVSWVERRTTRAWKRYQSGVLELLQAVLPEQQESRGRAQRPGVPGE